MSIAFAFCGKIGTYKLQSRHASHADESMVRSSFASFRRHVYDTAPFEKKHVFIHSWNPEVESLIRTLYTPQNAVFEGVLNGTSNCKSGTDCFRVYSYLKSIKSVLRLVFLEKVLYNFVFLSRFDVLWRVPFHYKTLTSDSYILPEHCSPVKQTLSEKGDKCRPMYFTSLENSSCTDFLCRHNSYLRNHSVLDMWIVGNHSLMKDFMKIGDDNTISDMNKIVSAHKPAWIVAHVYWGLFLKTKPVMHINYKEWIDWSLSRFPDNIPWSKHPLCYQTPIVERVVFKEKCRESSLCTNCSHI